MNDELKVKKMEIIEEEIETLNFLIDLSDDKNNIKYFKNKIQELFNKYDELLEDIYEN